MNLNEQSDVLIFLNGKLPNAILPKLCGGDKVVDLLFYRPLSYIDRSKSLSDAQVGEFTTFMAKVYEHQPPTFRGRPYKIVVESESQYMFIVFFNYSVKYLYKLFPIGANVIISGKLEKFAEHWQITHPDYVSLDINQFKEIACIEPVYQLCRGITNKRIGNIISSNLKELPDLPEWIDDTLIKQKNG